MTTRRALLSVMLLASVSLTACATGGGGDVPAAQRSHPTWLTGTWKGEVWQTGASLSQGQQPIAVTFASDGSWKSTAGGSGTSWAVGEKDKVVVEGVTGDGTPIKYTFKHRQKAGEEELWGTVQARFGTGAVSVTRTP